MHQILSVIVFEYLIDFPDKYRVYYNTCVTYLNKINTETLSCIIFKSSQLKYSGEREYFRMASMTQDMRK